jgi:hypothetical protein
VSAGADHAGVPILGAAHIKILGRRSLESVLIGSSLNALRILLPLRLHDFCYRVMPYFLLVYLVLRITTPMTVFVSVWEFRVLNSDDVLRNFSCFN